MLKPQMLDRLNSIFIMKGWDIDEDPNMPFERFSTNLARLEESDQLFILDITEKYNVYKLSDYEEMLNQCLHNLNIRGYFDAKTIKICPLLPFTEKMEIFEEKVLRYSKGEKKVKSSNLVCYLFKSNQISYKDYLKNTKFEVSNYLEEKDILSLKNNESKLLLVDDYIGSGKTAESAINSYTHLGVPVENITVLSLLIDEAGKKNLQKIEVTTVSSNYENYSLKDFEGYIDDEIREQVERIARKLKIAKAYWFGYADTMGLVSLVRTPNNTLPFYWFEKKDKDFYAPFPRFEERKNG